VLRHIITAYIIYQLYKNKNCTFPFRYSKAIPEEGGRELGTEMSAMLTRLKESILGGRAV
jgi:hypothetical protein